MRGRFLRRGVLALLIVAAASTLAFAQGSFFTSLSGTVADSSGAVIPGADVKIRNNGTGAEYNTITASDGGFSMPSLPGGTYTVTVSLMGFKTAVLNSVTLNASLPASVKVTLSVGTLEENVTVVGESATVVQTQSPAIATNLTGVADCQSAADRAATRSIRSRGCPASTRRAPRAAPPSAAFRGARSTSPSTA